jgi:MoxR-like ATPase
LSVEQTRALLDAQDYISDPRLATAVHLALVMHRPLLLEGEPGTGKTSIAHALAAGLGRRLVRLQCYEGLDLAQAAYEWDRARQLLAVRLAEMAGTADRDILARDLYGRAFLQPRALLSAIDPDLPPAVLLIDELDRADEPFEAFLLELLEDYQMTIPELGTIKARVPPVVIMTSNRTRDVHDAIRRRCLYHWLDFPDAARERAILARQAPEVPDLLADAVVAYVQKLRALSLYKPPGVAEMLDWARALVALGEHRLTQDAADRSVGALLKYHDDLAAAPPVD